MGVEGRFYTVDGGPDADPFITDGESTLSATVDSLREAPIGRIRTTVELATLLAHLEIRSRHFRRSILHASTFFMSKVMDYYSEDGPYLQRLQKEFLDDPRLVREAIGKELTKRYPGRRLPPGAVDKAMAMAKPMLPSLMPGIVEEFKQTVRTTRAHVLENIAAWTKSGHIDVLRRDLAPAPRVERFKELEFNVLEFGDEQILGDSMVVYRVSGEREYKPTIDKDDALLNVYLPISRRRVLIGCANGASLPQVNLQLNDMCAECSLEFFVAGADTPALQGLARRIGENAEAVSDAEMLELLGELAAK